MNQNLYAQVIHILGIIVVAVLVGIGKIDSNTAIGLISLLVGIALPTPYKAVPSV